MATPTLQRFQLVLVSLLSLSISVQAQDTPAPEPAVPAASELPGTAGPDDAELAALDAQLSGTVGPGWLINYRAARKQAEAEDKDLILLFTGSDWIDICKKLDDEVLNTETFFQPISENFVPVRFDFPREKKLNDAITAQNQLMMASYRVQGLPTVILCDAAGLPYAVNGYQAVSAKEYATIVSALRAVKLRRDQKFAAAESATGLEKAQLLADGIPTLPGNLSAWYYRPQMQALISSDLQNKTGKAVQFQRLLNDVDYSSAMTRLAKNVEWAKMIRLTDDYIRNNQLKGEELQHALMNKAGVLRSQGKAPVMVQTLLEIVAIDPDTATATRAQQTLDQMRLEMLQQEQLRNSGSTTETATPEKKP